MATCLMFGTLTREARKAACARKEAFDTLAAVQGKQCPR
jgi:hypothetical protein